MDIETLKKKLNQIVDKMEDEIDKTPSSGEPENYLKVYLPASIVAEIREQKLSDGQAIQINGHVAKKLSGILATSIKLGKGLP